MKQRRTLPTVFLILSLVVGLLGNGCGSDEPASPTPASSTINITVEGLPDSVEAKLTLTGPDGLIRRQISGTTTLSDLMPGGYLLTADVVSASPWEYAASPDSQNLRLLAGGQLSVSVAYVGALSLGSLRVDLSGLPTNDAGSVLVTGPEGYERALQGSTTLSALRPGAYQITAEVVVIEGQEYAPSPASQDASVRAGEESIARISYATGGSASLDLRIGDVRLVQSTQRRDNSVPLIRDREALLRVFVVANEANARRPDVRVEFSIGGSVQQVATIAAPRSSVPLVVEESDLRSSWNFVVPRSLVQPNLSLGIEVDPANQIAESVESNNRYPASGSSANFDVATMAALSVRLVPVRQAANGMQGDATNSNRESYVALAEELFPFPSVDVDVRAVYTTDAPELQANDANGAWVTVLQEILALRNDSDRSNRYYFGVVATTYNSGIAGLGYVPENRAAGYNAAVGWDKATSRASVAAHEIGHNLGRKHSPCGSPSGVDPDYPYSGASIGVWGYQASATDLKDPSSATDIMGYCNDQWISDYTFERMLSFMGPTYKVPAEAPTPCLLLWGRIVNGQPVLEPAFVLEAVPVLPGQRGPHRIELLDADGVLSLRLDFEGVPIGDHPTDAQAFAWRVPLSSESISSLGEIRLTSQGGRRVQRVAVGPKRAASVALRRTDPESVLLQWDPSIWPMAMVRDAQSGEILSFARSGRSEIHTPADLLDVQLSDGVRTAKRRFELR